MLQKVLCPTDLTDDSRDGVSCAIRLARENGAQLIVFHVTSFPRPLLYEGALEDGAHWQRLVSEFNMERVLASAEQRIRRFMEARFQAELGGIVWRAKATVGNTVQEIVDAALREEIDLIVTGRCKKALLARLFSASVQEALLRSAPCPVLSVDTAKITHAERRWRLPLLKEVFQSS